MGKGKKHKYLCIRHIPIFSILKSQNAYINPYQGRPRDQSIQVLCKLPCSKETSYAWNNMQSPEYEVNVGVGQGSALSPILSALYLTLFLHILEKCLKNLKYPFLCFLLLMMDLLLPKTVSLSFQTPSFSVATMSFPNFSQILV